MRNNVSFVLILLALLITFPKAMCEVQSTSETQAQTPSPEAVKLGENLYRIGRVTVDTNKREVTIRGWVNMNDGLIEYLACSAGGKLHESVFVLDTKPIHLQVALILIGLEAKGDFEFQGDPRPPKGDPVEIWVEWKENGKERRVRAEEIINDMKMDKPMPQTHWVFTGSIIYQGRYLAEIEKSLVATYHDPAAIINNPLPEGADDTVYGVNPKIVPNRGTPVVMMFKAANERTGNPASLPTVEAQQNALEKNRSVVFYENFDSGNLNPKKWKVTKDGEFNQFAVDVQNVNSGSQTDYRLCLMATTLNTSDPVKYLGVRSLEKIDFIKEKEIDFDLDWNNQNNGCYLTAGLYICPYESENPKNEKDWIKFDWVGVPPGKNIRTNIWANVNGALKQLYTDWGPKDENGRPQGRAVNACNHHIQMIFNGKRIQVWADSKQLCNSLHLLSFTSGYLYFQISSGTNYPKREIYFDNIVVTEVTK